jgi:hypothetical protein
MTSTTAAVLRHVVCVTRVLLKGPLKSRCDLPADRNNFSTEFSIATFQSQRLFICDLRPHSSGMSSGLTAVVCLKNTPSCRVSKEHALMLVLLALLCYYTSCAFTTRKGKKNCPCHLPTHLPPTPAISPPAPHLPPTCPPPAISPVAPHLPHTCHIPSCPPVAPHLPSPQLPPTCPPPAISPVAPQLPPTCHLPSCHPPAPHNCPCHLPSCPHTPHPTPLFVSTFSLARFLSRHGQTSFDHARLGLEISCARFACAASIKASRETLLRLY